MNLATTYQRDATERLVLEVQRLQRDLGLDLEAAITRAGQASIAGPAVWAEVRSRLTPWVLRRDGDVAGRFTTEQEAWTYLHRVHSFSVSHALRYEGYTLAQEVAR